MADNDPCPTGDLAGIEPAGIPEVTPASPKPAKRGPSASAEPARIDGPTLIQLPAGLLKLQIRPLPLPESDDVLAALHLSEARILDLLTILPPVVLRTQDGNSYTITGFSELTAALIRRLPDDLKIDCLLVSRRVSSGLEPLALIASQVSPKQLVGWLVTDGNWQAWMGDTKKTAASVSAATGIGREAARLILKSLNKTR